MAAIMTVPNQIARLTHDPDSPHYGRPPRLSSIGNASTLENIQCRKPKTLSQNREGVPISTPFPPLFLHFIYNNFTCVKLLLPSETCRLQAF